MGFLADTQQLHGFNGVCGDLNGVRGPRSLDGRMYSYIMTRISAGSLMKGKVSIALSHIGGLPAPKILVRRMRGMHFH